jgi:hypothetical protein
MVNYNGLLYWNTTMPMLQDSLNLDTLDAHGQLLGYYSDGPNPGDTLNVVTSYRVALTSFPQFSVDGANNLYVVYSGVTWKDPSPEGIHYRHLFGRARFHDKMTWSADPIDLNDDITYYGQEFIFASMAKHITGDKLRLLYQTADQPGTAVGTSTGSLPIPYHDNVIQYREVPGSTFWPAGLEQNNHAGRNPVGRNYPNPVKGLTNINVSLDAPSAIVAEVANVTGQKILSLDKGIMGTGIHKITLDGSLLMPGIYFYTVRINGTSYVHKMIVE